MREPRNRVVQVRRFGGPDGLEVVDAPLPTAGRGEVRVRVLASGTEYTDVLIRRHLYPQVRPVRGVLPQTSAECCRSRTSQIVRTILLARATAATLAGRRAWIPFCQAVGALVWYITDRAPWINSVRKYESPRFEIDPNRILPPVPLCRGTSPRNAASSRPDLNALASPIVATSAVAVSLPMPGTCGDRAARRFLLLPAADALLKLIDILLEPLDALQLLLQAAQHHSRQRILQLRHARSHLREPGLAPGPKRHTKLVQQPA